MPKRSLKTLDDIIEKNPQGVDWHTSEETQKLMAMMTPLNRRKVIHAQEESHLKVGALYRRTRDGMQRAEVRFDGVSGCLRTPGGGSIIVDGSVIRSRLLSPREAARLMGLKDSYLLPSRYNDAYHLAGDGVVVPVVSHLDKNILGVIIEKNREVVSFAEAA